MELLEITYWDEDLVNEKVHILYKKLCTNADIQRCVKIMKQTYKTVHIDDAFAFYLLLTPEYFDIMKPCIDEFTHNGSMSTQTFSNFCTRIK